MSDANRDNNRRFGHRRFGNQGSRTENREERKTREPPAQCTACGKPIFDLSSALAGSENGAPLHFDCALQKVGEREALGPREKIVYIGAGNFAVVEFRDQSETTFDIKRKISFERKDLPCEWRRGMSSRIAELGIMGVAPAAPEA
ncbi:MAG: hypothetical protein NT080_08005 [Spirochaetes bacterium]|nr:hypothetical protein [Spirochaetota bacterium]